MTLPEAPQGANFNTWTLTTQQSQIRRVLQQTMEWSQGMYWQMRDFFSLFMFVFCDNKGSEILYPTWWVSLLMFVTLSPALQTSASRSVIYRSFSSWNWSYSFFLAMQRVIRVSKLCFSHLCFSQLCIRRYLYYCKLLNECAFDARAYSNGWRS